MRSMTHVSAQRCAWHRASAQYLELLRWTWILPSGCRLRTFSRYLGTCHVPGTACEWHLREGHVPTLDACRRLFHQLRLLTLGWLSPFSHEETKIH